MSYANYAQIIDGFSYSLAYATRPLFGNWYQASLASLDNLRLCAENYRPRWWVFPDQFALAANPNSAVILAGKTFYYQFQVKAGSYLWAMNFTALNTNAPTTPVALNASRFSLTVAETASDNPLFDQVIAASAIRAPSAGATFTADTDNLYPPVQMLPAPRLILDPGNIRVEITNTAAPQTPANSVQCQLALFFAEPK